MRIERFDSVVANYSSISQVERDSALSLYAPAVDFMQRITGIGSADTLLTELAGSRAFEVFYPDVLSHLPSLSGIEKQLGVLRVSLPQQVDSLQFPARVFGIVTPYEQSVILSDSVLIVGLNHYLGADYEGYQSFDVYRRALKTPSRMPIDIAEALIYTARPFETTPTSTLLQRMIYEGAVVDAVVRSLPGIDAPTALGYTPEQFEWLESNEGQIWEKLVAENMLYSTDRSMTERMVLPAPFTSVISTDSPGRAGRYIGYKIVESFLSNNPDYALSDILDSSLLHRENLLLKSGYAPK